MFVVLSTVELIMKVTTTVDKYFEVENVHYKYEKVANGINVTKVVEPPSIFVHRATLTTLYTTPIQVTLLVPETWKFGW